MSWIYNHSVAVLMSISQHKFMSKTKNEAPNLEHGLMKRVLFSKVKEEIRQMFTGLVENVQTFGRTSSFSHIKTADSSHLSLQRNVVVQPFEGIQQRLLGVWNFARAENREREREKESDMCEERGSQRSRTETNNCIIGKTTDGPVWACCYKLQMKIK